MNDPRLAGAAALVLGFLLGSIPFGLLWGRALRGIDVREHGSRNLGATNVFRVLGPAHGIAVLLLDVGKGMLAVWAAGRLGGGQPVAALAGLAAVLGHLYSPWVGFRGGKGVATGLGVWLVLAPAATGIALAAFALVLAAARRVSAGSLAASLALVLALLARGGPALLVAAAAGTAALVWFRHRGNIARLARGAEPPRWGGEKR